MCTAGLAGSSEQVNAGLRLPDASAPPSVARNVCQLIPPATAATRPDLQRQPGAFREHYNEHHLGIGAAHRGKEIPAITDMTGVTVIEPRTGEVLSAHDIDPIRAYWRNKQRSRDRWPGPSVS
jgi:hypothetical protein